MRLDFEQRTVLTVEASYRSQLVSFAFWGVPGPGVPALEGHKAQSNRGRSSAPRKARGKRAIVYSPHENSRDPSFPGDG
jgi:hypothetical protein